MKTAKKIAWGSSICVVMPCCNAFAQPNLQIGSIPSKRHRHQLKDILSFLGEGMMNCRKIGWLMMGVVCLSALVLALPHTAWSQAPGDANNDGRISRADLSAIVDHILGRVQLRTQTATRMQQSTFGMWSA